MLRATHAADRQVGFKKSRREQMSRKPMARPWLAAVAAGLLLAAGPAAGTQAQAQAPKPNTPPAVTRPQAQQQTQARAT